MRPLRGCLWLAGLGVAALLLRSALLEAPPAERAYTRPHTPAPASSPAAGTDITPGAPPLFADRHVYWSDAAAQYWLPKPSEQPPHRQVPEGWHVVAVESHHFPWMFRGAFTGAQRSWVLLEALATGRVQRFEVGKHCQADGQAWQITRIERRATERAQPREILCLEAAAGARHIDLARGQATEAFAVATLTTPEGARVEVRLDEHLPPPLDDWQVVQISQHPPAVEVVNTALPTQPRQLVSSKGATARGEGS